MEKPVLDDMALKDLNDVLAEKLFYNPYAQIKYWEDGYYKMIECSINKFDSETNKLEVVKDDEKIRINMDCILEIV